MKLTVPEKPKWVTDVHLYLLRIFGSDGVYVRSERLFWARDDTDAGRTAISKGWVSDEDEYAITRQHE